MLLERLADNPLIAPDDVPASRADWQVVGAFNPGVATYGDEIILLLRVAERPRDVAEDEEVAPIYNAETGKVEYLRVKHNDPELQRVDSRVFFYKGKMYLTSISHLRLARSKDGRCFNVDTEPAVFPAEHYESFGLEDPRITKLNDEFYITYKVVSEFGICTALLKTKDFKKFTRKGIIFCPENLDVVLFPKKIDGQFCALTRPVPKNIGPPAIWLSFSPDGLHWGRYKPIILPREGKFDACKVGPSCVPIVTDAGWLEIYHGTDETDRYCLGAALLDLKEPSSVIARSEKPLMKPQADYELNGFYGNVIFASGAVVNCDGQITVYYGAADSFTAAATTTIDKIMKPGYLCRKSSQQ